MGLRSGSRAAREERQPVAASTNKGRLKGASSWPRLMLKEALNAMFLAKIKVALLACGLIATGAFVVGQQVGRPLPEGNQKAGDPSASESGSVRSGNQDDDEIVTKEMGRLDLELLAGEVQELRARVEVTLRNKLRAERTNFAGASRAERAFDAARTSYLAAARELREARRRLNSVDEEFGLERVEPQRTSDTENAAQSQPVSQPVQRASAAAIGSIDLDAVFRKSEKALATNREFNAARLSRKNHLVKLLEEAQVETEILSKFTPESEDRKRHEIRATDLKARYEAAREQTEREFDRRQAETMAALYSEIQETVARVAKTKGLTYVVKVSPGLRPDAEPNDVSSELNRSVVYYDPRNDLTEEESDERASDSEDELGKSAGISIRQKTVPARHRRARRT